MHGQSIPPSPKPLLPFPWPLPETIAKPPLAPSSMIAKVVPRLFWESVHSCLADTLAR